MEINKQKSRKKDWVWIIAALLMLGSYLGYSDGRRDSGNKVVSISEVHQ